MNVPECKYCLDEICVNDKSPMCADFCPVVDYPEVCRYEDRVNSMTNGDRIRAMTDEELASFMAERNVNESTLLLINEDYALTAVQIEAIKHRVYCAYKQWLKQPVKGDAE